MDNNTAFGEITGEKLELLVDGERVKLYDWDKDVARGKPVHGGTADVHFQVKAGLHTVGVTFLATNWLPGSDLDEHFLRSTIETGGLPGFKFYPHVGKMEILGPFKPDGRERVAQREQDFRVPAKADASEETACAKQIVDTLARHAFRRPVTAQDTETLMSFYQQGRNDGDLRYGHREGAATHSGGPRVRVPQGNRAGEYCAGPKLSHQRSGTGLASVVLSCGAAFPTMS